jgi:hypothetical protein
MRFGHLDKMCYNVASICLTRQAQESLKDENHLWMQKHVMLAWMPNC